MTIFKNPNLEKKVDVGAEAGAVERAVCAEPPLVVPAEDGRDGGKWKAVVRVASVVGSTVMILALSLAVGVACGRLYRHYVLSQQGAAAACARLRPSATSCSVSVPFDGDRVPFLKAEVSLLPRSGAGLATFRQDLEIDVEQRRYVSVGVSYKERRAAVFVHDFRSNISAIVDLKNDRCYVLPLNACQVMPPNVLFNLVHKTMHGFVLNDQPVVEESYHAVLPPVSTSKVPSCAIVERCVGRPIYMLVRCSRGTVGDVPDEFRFAEYAGNGILLYGVDNYRLIERFESDYTA